MKSKFDPSVARLLMGLKIFYFFNSVTYLGSFGDYPSQLQEEGEEEKKIRNILVYRVC